MIRKELEDKRRRVRQITTLLKDASARWDVVRVELDEIQEKYGDARRTSIASDEGEVDYTAELEDMPGLPQCRRRRAGDACVDEDLHFRSEPCTAGSTRSAARRRDNE